MTTETKGGGGALAVYSRVDNPIAFAKEMAKTFAAMTGVPLEQGEAVALTCLCEGLTPVDYRRRYHTIDGKPSMRADAMLAEFRLNHGGRHKIVERTAERAALVLIDRDGNEAPCEFTWEEAQQSRWPWKDWKEAPEKRRLKDNWATPTDRKALLWARCVSDGLRAVCPELVAGVYTPEEMQDAIDADYTVVSSTPVNGRSKKSSLDIAREAAERQAAQQPAAGESPASGQVAADGATADGGDADDALEAEFEIQPAADGAAATPADEAADASQRATGAAEEAPGAITEAQREEIKSLAEYLAIPHEQLQAILAKRGVQSFRSLSREQGEEILAKFRSFARSKRAAEGHAGN